MLQLEKILDGLPEKITIRFFATFSRFEMALMRCGYLRAGRQNMAEADWTRLPEDLGANFFDGVAASGQAVTLINDPPKILIVQNGALVFGQKPKPVKTSVELFKSARQVRNNLFHGNKMFATDRQRDTKLMSEVLWLIEFMMDQLPYLRGTFDEPQQ
jgi:hypothetical protein